LGSAFPEPSGCKYSYELWQAIHVSIYYSIVHDTNFLTSTIFIHDHFHPFTAVAWVEEAFGPQVSLLCGYFHWISGAVCTI
jgi:hypothetical protein